MKVIHLSAECYPVAKVGGLADVVGSLPKYLVGKGLDASVVMPKYRNKWVEGHKFETVFEGDAPLDTGEIVYSIQLEKDNTLGFPLYVVDIPGLLDRPGIYTDPNSGSAYWDEFERFLGFQIAALDWIKEMKKKPDVVHCHDHHAGLAPFMMTQSFRYKNLKMIPTVFTVHNGEYHGSYDRWNDRLIPDYDRSNSGLLDWNGRLNCMAAGLKCAWQISTVSESYMEELCEKSNGLEPLFRSERAKSRGIVNGIDTQVWNPKTDTYLDRHYDVRTRKAGKASNKKKLCKRFGLDPKHPTISYIGRLAYEKGADLLPNLFRNYLSSQHSVNFVVLGTGDPALHDQFNQMSDRYVGYFDAALDYNEKLAHLIYAGSDFMIMPSRVEPCGLNQMYCMRYGTIPIVRSIGGLKDTVKDLDEEGGYGIKFQNFDYYEAAEAVWRAISLYGQPKIMSKIRKKIMELDFSWNASATEYIKMYNEITIN